MCQLSLDPRHRTRCSRNMMLIWDDLGKLCGAGYHVRSSHVMRKKVIVCLLKLCATGPIKPAFPFIIHDIISKQQQAPVKVTHFHAMFTTPISVNLHNVCWSGILLVCGDVNETRREAGNFYITKTARD